MRDGRFQPVDPVAFRKAFKIPENTVVLLTVEALGPKRTGDQNAWYWAGIIPLIALEIGEDDHRIVHEDLKKRLHSRIDRVKVGKRWKYIRRVRSTANLSTAEFWDWCEKVRRFAATFLNLDVKGPA